MSKADFVHALFEGIAVSYDLLNDLMTGGMHRLWKSQVLDLLQLKSGFEGRILDLCCGTGDLALQASKRFPLALVSGLDFSENMLELARLKNKTERLEFIQGDAMALPFEGESFAGVTLGFGLRNVADAGGCLREVLRVLEPKGVLVILELVKSEPAQGFDLLRSCFDFYRLSVLPWLGGLVAGSESAYAYLPNSAERFLSVEELAEQLRVCGFVQVQSKAWFFGSVALVSGERGHAV